jgi:ribosomal protein S18 acetylase RimI-like enzyme
MSDAIDIRPAQTGDAEVAAVLLYSAYTHEQVTYPLPDEQNAGWIEHLRDFFRRDGNRFSYQNCQVAVHGADVVGLVLSFGGRDEPRLNAAVGGWLEREAKDDEWYIDALAVLQDWGHQGVGTLLMHAAEREARQRGYATVALSVAPDNRPALALYRRLRYVVTEETVLYQRPYLRMVKALDSAATGGDGADRIRHSGTDGRQEPPHLL